MMDIYIIRSQPLINAEREVFFIFVIIRFYAWGSREIAPLIFFKNMALSVRTRIKDKNWTKLIRELPEGVHKLPTKFNHTEFNTLRQTCWRESQYDTPYLYLPSIDGFSVTITKSKK